MLRYFLAVIFLVAGIIHIVSPEKFSPAIFWGLEDLSNYAAGVIEIVLAILLVRKHRLAGKLSAAWLFILIPVHVYISVKGIPMFGVNDPVILWARTALQLPVIWFAWRIR